MTDFTGRLFTGVKNDGNRTIEINGLYGNVRAGANGQDGDIVLYKESDPTSAWRDFNKASIHLNGGNGNMRLGGNGVDGDIALFPRGATASTVGNFNNASIHLNGDTGDIILRNADCAEDFAIKESEQTGPGTVMVIDEDGRLCASSQAYDRRVAGVISGAGAFKPGIILGRTESSEHKMPIALNGRVYCHADARENPIRVGDLLTTSATPGHAMRADDPLRAFGAVIGKAMEPLLEGTGLIPILVALQ